LRVELSDTDIAKRLVTLMIRRGYYEITVKSKIRCGMIKENPEEKDVFRTTKKGDAMIDTLCSTPEPILVWVDVNGKVLMRGEEL